jgi:DtxR family Mn-dependent transcriptional regulator
VELTEGLQDYLEAILLCEKKHRFVRTKHLALRLGVKSPSVHSAVKELTRLGLVDHESYGHIELTAEGRREAELVYNRHQVLYRFFYHILGLPVEVSEISACGIEHHLDENSVTKLSRLLDYLDRKSEEDPAFARELKEALKDDPD